MSESMSNVERGLWRIAELGARCSQHSATGSRGPLWAELEETITGLEAEFEAARQAGDITPPQVRNLEGRLNVAKKERDRELVRAKECFADAEAARRERDREKARTAKAVAAAAEARATAAECIARATAAQAALDQAVSAQEEAVGRLDQAVTARDQAIAALRGAKAALAGTKAALDETKATLDDTKAALVGTKASLADTKAGLKDTQATLADTRATLAATQADLDEAKDRIALLHGDLDSVRADLEAAQTERDALVAAAARRVDALDAMTARAEGAVVVLPGVGLPEPAAGPMAPARVSWQPTWSEWARDTDESDTATAPAVTPVAAPRDDVADTEVVLDDGEEVGVRRYLNVAATIGQLLPHDLGPLLLSGATVVRREGRLFATVAVTADPWSPPGLDGADQAKKLADAGFRVEWTTTAPLAC